MWVKAQNPRLFLALVAALIALAWVTLWVWGQSPYGRYLDHEALSEIASEDVLLLGLFVAGWTLMVFAMMLPTSLPLLTLFYALTRSRPDHIWLVTLVVTGYVGVWASFGVMVHAGDLAIHEATEQVGWLDSNAWVIGAATIMLAGIYQFTPLKYHCLDKCRSPLTFVMGHWRGNHEWRQSLRLRLDHGVYCLGCCWSLMLLMFVVGAGNIGWMLVLGMVMGVEKNMPWGRRLSKPLGLLLVLGSGAIILDGLSPSIV